MSQNKEENQVPDRNKVSNKQNSSEEDQIDDVQPNEASSTERSLISRSSVDPNNRTKNDLFDPEEGSIPGDGIDVMINPLDDEFQEEYNAQTLDQEGQIEEQNNFATPVQRQDEDPEISFSAKKQYLKEEIRKDPQLKRLFQEVLAEDGSRRKSAKDPAATKGTAKPNITATTPLTDKTDKDRITETRRRIPVIKSPSGTTIYTPALKKIQQNNETSKLIQKISNFVETIRIESEMGTMFHHLLQH